MLIHYTFIMHGYKLEKGVYYDKKYSSCTCEFSTG